MRYLFKHVLMRDAVYGIQLGAFLRELHRKAAEAIQNLYLDDLASHYIDLAYHYDCAQDTDLATYYALLAAKRSIATSHYREARAILERGLAILQGCALPDVDERQVSLLKLLGDVHQRLSNGSLAATYYEQSLDLARQLGTPVEIAEALIGLGDTALRAGDYSIAWQHYEQALTHSDQDLKNRATALSGLGHVSREQGDYTAAWEYYWRGFVIREETDDRWGVADSLRRLGNTAYNRGDYVLSEVYHRQCLAICRELDSRSGVAKCLNNLGAIAHIQGDYDAAQDCYQQSLCTEREVGDRRGVAISLINLALVARQKGDCVTALEYSQQSLAIFREIGDQWGITVVLGDLVTIQVALGQPEAAKQSLYEGMVLARDIGAVPRILSLLVGAVHLALSEEHRQQAAEWASLVVHHPATEQDYRDEVNKLESELKAMLSSGDLSAAWQRGKSRDLGAVVAEILSRDSEISMD